MNQPVQHKSGGDKSIMNTTTKTVTGTNNVYKKYEEVDFTHVNFLPEVKTNDELVEQHRYFSMSRKI